jgi:alginate O-acetyltransferase complex protein AlgI
VRYNSIQEQLQNRIHSWDQFSGGATRFIRGLAQKVLIADLAGKVAQSVFSTPTHELSLAAAWTGIIFYTIQIYFDFSGYSSMAIGLAKMFGFDFQENFNFPYISKSITEFWTRWHISLSTWFKNYVYIPLGGNRKGLLRTMMNQWIVFVLCGLWHGASASFLIWGIYYGTLISLEKIPFISNIQKKLPVIAQHLLTLLLIIIGWVLFVSDQVTGKEYIMTLFGFGRGAWTYSITILDWGVIILGIFFSTPIFIKTLDSIKNANRRNLLVILLSIFIFILACVVMISSIYHPFLYFRF